MINMYHDKAPSNVCCCFARFSIVDRVEGGLVVIQKRRTNNGSPVLRKHFSPDVKLIRKLVHGALLGRGAAEHKNAPGEATMPIDGDFFCLLCGTKAKSVVDARAAFKPSSASKPHQIQKRRKCS